MQFKWMPMLAGAIALSVTPIPLVVQAELAPSSPQLLAQAREPRKLEALGLTQEQQTRIAEIRRNTRSQMEAVLTPEQREKLKAARESRQQRRETFAALNLTPEQKTKLRQIRQSAKSQFEAVLTPEQRQKLQQFRQSRGWQRQQGDR